MSLCEWYANRTVLLTGVTSELGRAVLEKLLRTLPDVKVCVILRSRDGLSKDDRLKKIFASPGYERLRQEVPSAISRVQAFEGNLLCQELGLSAEDKASLREVTVAFHAAGPHSVVLEYCQDLPKLRCVALASSIFKYRGKISESLQNEDIPKIPVALVRFPFIGPAHKQPMPGFVEILRGPTAFMVGAGYAFGNADSQAELVPMDLAVNTMIAAAWEVATSDIAEPVVYNAATIGCTWHELEKKSRRASWSFPYPTFGIRGMTNNASLYWILIVLLEWLPSMLCDSVLSLCGGKQRIVAEYDRVRNALRSLKSISWRPWPAERKRVYRLESRLTEKDREMFPVTADIDIEAYILCVAATVRKYCVSEANLQIMKVVRTLLLLTPAIFVVTYIVFLNYRTKIAIR
ncbi:putative fatty acyl-CoA reductase CG5065 [Harpegnathos saltator]|uniref:Fatty acyl-CoA reductase n=1 Tax=Harpegnathos saltator TaxID=610380 RepID=E2BLI2_HARSA|nr:putative fatty acyl-CoA reductase CG5065 [Harpegnathos saltator]EFN83450.1 Fatty acyl-CoA reductase 1 [Harpegnathos saltator]